MIGEKQLQNLRLPIVHFKFAVHCKRNGASAGKRGNHRRLAPKPLSIGRLERRGVVRYARLLANTLTLHFESRVIRIREEQAAEFFKFQNQMISLFHSLRTEVLIEPPPEPIAQ